MRDAHSRTHAQAHSPTLEHAQWARPSGRPHRAAFSQQYLNDPARGHADPCGMDVFRADPAASADFMARHRFDMFGDSRGEYIVASARTPEFKNVVERDIVQLRFFHQLANGGGRHGFADLAAAAGQRPSSVRSRDEQNAIGAQAQDGSSVLHDRVHK